MMTPDAIILNKVRTILPHFPPRVNPNAIPGFSVKCISNQLGKIVLLSPNV
jgi:hypothetical protein